jgi:hypothetical protein
LTSANVEQDRIKLEFMNKGKLPIEQLSLSCAPTNNKSRSTICLNETGIFYPGTEYWIDILIRARIPTVQSSRSKRFAWPAEYFGICPSTEIEVIRGWMESRENIVCH